MLGLAILHYYTHYYTYNQSLKYYIQIDLIVANFKLI